MSAAFVTERKLNFSPAIFFLIIADICCIYLCFLFWNSLSQSMLTGQSYCFYFQRPVFKTSGVVLSVYQQLHAPSPPSLYPADTPHRRSDTREPELDSEEDYSGWCAAFRCCSCEPRCARSYLFSCLFVCLFQLPFNHKSIVVTIPFQNII